MNSSYPIRRALILGKNGMLGTSWTKLLTTRGIPYSAVGPPELDLRNPGSIEATVTDEFDLIVNCAAYTAVDRAEEEEPLATRINGEAVGELAAQAKAHNARLIHYSTDYVFDGNAESPYTCDTPLSPLNAYGRTKAAGELALARSGARTLLIRTSWVYAPWGANFVLTMAKLMQERGQLKVVNDQQGRPTSAERLALRSFQLSQSVESGIFHLTDEGECTWYHFACEIRDALGLSTRIEPCTSQEFARPAPRPAYGVLDLSKVQRLLGPGVPWQKALREVLSVARA